MCASCGCGRPLAAHGDRRHLTLRAIEAAADVAGISTRQVARNIRRTVAAADGRRATKAVRSPAVAYATCQVVKAQAPQRYTLGLAYPAMRPDVAVAADGRRDFVSAEALEKCAWTWLAKYRDVNLFHAGETSGHFTPTESYIYRGPNWSIESPVDGKTYVIKAGSWLLGGVWDPYGWDLVLTGRVRGWSPEGDARRSVPSAERLAQLRSEDG